MPFNDNQIIQAAVDAHNAIQKCRYGPHPVPLQALKDALSEAIQKKSLDMQRLPRGCAEHIRAGGQLVRWTRARDLVG